MCSSTHQSEGEIGAALSAGITACIDGSYSDDYKNTLDMFMTRFNSSENAESISSVENPTINILSTITNNHCGQSIDNLNKPFNYSGNFGDYCPIKCQEKQSTVLVNISNPYNKTIGTNYSSFSANTKNDFKGCSAYNYSTTGVLRSNEVNITEPPVNVHILRSSHRNKVRGTQTQSSIILSCSLPGALTPWKTDTQSAQMNSIQGQENHIVKSSRQNVNQSNSYSEQLNESSSETGKTNRENKLSTANTWAVRPEVQNCNGSANGSSTRRDAQIKDTIKVCADNLEAQNRTNDVIHGWNLNTMVIHNKEILKTLPLFSVVPKKLKWLCSFCGEQHATRFSLITHMKSHLLPWCKICLKILNSNEQFLSHMEKKHPTLEEEMDQPEMQLVTSKYGRKRRVYSPATLLPKRRMDLRK